jgi:hypothetical protein
MEFFYTKNVSYIFQKMTKDILFITLKMYFLSFRATNCPLIRLHDYSNI